jgi:AAA domain
MTAPSKREVFQALCEAKAILVANGELDFQAAIDGLHDHAQGRGLIVEYGDDAVQEIMCAAFKDCTPPTSNGFEDPPPTSNSWEAFDQLVEEERQTRESRRNGNGGRVSPADEEQAREPFIARAFAWPDPAKIPPRQFLFGKHYARKTIGATIGGGGRAKTTLAIAEAISMACGRNVLTGETIKPLRVLCLNGEEDQDELDRRVTATCQSYGVTEAQCDGRLFVQSVRNKPLRLATLHKGAPVLNRTLLSELEEQIKLGGFDVFMLDPLVSFHSIIENDNGHMDLLLKEGLGAIAGRTDSAGEVFHHPGKPKPGQDETVVEDARGASAIIWAVRSARVLNFMTPQDATKLGIGEDTRRLHIRVMNGKANMGPLGKATWFKLEVENLANGDEIACASSWKPPDPFQGINSADMHHCRTLAQTGAYRFDSRSEDWFGYAVAKVLNINITHGADNSPEDIARIKQILSMWLKNKVLATEQRKDKNRKDRAFVIPGPWQEEAGTGPADEGDHDAFAA